MKINPKLSSEINDNITGQSVTSMAKSHASVASTFFNKRKMLANIQDKPKVCKILEKRQSMKYKSSGILRFV